MLYVEFDLEVAKRIWREEAREDGLEEGIREGEKKGEKKKAIEMAKKMLIKNKPMDEIIEFTGLTEKQILNIKK